MVFTENQATQFYVAKTFKTGETKASALTNKGDILVGTTKDGKKYLQVKGADTILRSALIDPKYLMDVKVTEADKMSTPLYCKKVKLASDPVPGQDYTMHIIVRQYQGISDEQSMVKTAAVHVTAEMKTKEAFYKKMVESLKLNFKRELNQLLTFEYDENGITITEVEQPWMLGTFEQVPVYFDIIAGTIYVDGDEVLWADKENFNKAIPTETKVGNGRKIADMEYFFMGERGDQYRQIGWPNYIPTKYLVTAEDEDGKAKKYATLNIHFAYVGSNESVQKSEKDIMVVAEEYDTLKSIADAIVKDTNVTVEEIKAV